MRDLLLAVVIGVVLSVPLALVYISEPTMVHAQVQQGRSDPLVNGGLGSLTCASTSGQLLPANADRFRLWIHNPSSSASIAVTTTTVQGTCNGAAALNASCSITISPLGSITVDQTRWTSAIACISSAGPSPVTTFEW